MKHFVETGFDSHVANIIVIEVIFHCLEGFLDHIRSSNLLKYPFPITLMSQLESVPDWAVFAGREAAESTNRGSRVFLRTSLGLSLSSTSTSSSIRFMLFS